MKKFLIAFCLVLTLCLVTGAALAYTPTTEDDYEPWDDTDTWTDHEDPDSQFAGISYDEVYRVHEYKFMDDYGKVRTHFVGDEGVYIIVEPTCTEQGIVRYICSEPVNDWEYDENDPDYDPPKHFHEEFIKPLGHDPIKWKTTKQATCTEAGEKVGYCKRCGIELDRQTIPALGHIMTSQWFVWTDAEKAEYLPWETDLVVDPMSSEFNYEWFWGRIIKLPTCYEEGEAIDFCPRCGFEGDHRIIEMLPHTWETNWDEPNCLWTGYEWQNCKVCGAYNDAYDAEGSYNVGDMAYAWHFDWHWGIIDGEGWDWTEWKHDDFYAEDDNVGDGRRVLALDRFNHDWDGWVILQDSTCHEEGFKLHWCKRCGDKAEVVIPVKDPVWVPLDSRLINCYTREVTYYCALCNPNGINDKHLAKCDHQPYTVQYPVISHVWKTEIVEEPWCDQPGLSRTYCIYEDHPWHETWAEDNYYGLDYSGMEPLYTVTYDEIPELGHKWGGWVLRYGQYFNDASGNEFGYWLRECVRKDGDRECHVTEERVSYYAPADSCEVHNFVDKEIYNEPACWKNGWEWKRVVCTECGYEKTEYIDVEHDFDEIVVKESTCEDWGHTIKVCKVPECGYSEDVWTEPTDHEPIIVPEVAASCFAPGWTEKEICAKCGAEFNPGEEIPAIGYHDYQKIAAVEPTCTADGNTEGVVCTVCGDVMVESKAIPALGHDYVTEPGKAATCEEAGYTESVICSRCGDVQKAKEDVAALGHNWGDWTVTTEATTEAKGVETRVCKNDASHVETRDIDKLPKAPIYYFVGEPTIDEDGWFTGKVEHDPETTKPAYAVVRVSMYMPNGDIVTCFSLVRADETYKVQFAKSMLKGAVAYAAQVMAEVENPASPEAVFYGEGENWMN